MIRAQALTKQYGGRRVVDEVTVEAGAGECVALTGAPGSGRRTLLRMLSTLVRPSSGTVMIDGVDAAVDTIAVRKRIGFADPAFLTERGLRVGEYLRFLGRVRRVPVPGPDALRLRRWLSPVRLDPGSSIASLDGRERAVLAATAALLVRPAALFLDDPFAGLDAGTLTALVERIDDARQRGAAVVVRTNDEAALSALEARVVTLVSGRVSEPIDGTAA